MSLGLGQRNYATETGATAIDKRDTHYMWTRLVFPRQRGKWEWKTLAVAVTQRARSLVQKILLTNRAWLRDRFSCHHRHSQPLQNVTHLLPDSRKLSEKLVGNASCLIKVQTRPPAKCGKTPGELEASALGAIFRIGIFPSLRSEEKQFSPWGNFAISLCSFCNTFTRWFGT